MKEIGPADKLRRLKARRIAVLEAIRAIEQLGLEFGRKLAPHVSVGKFSKKHLTNENSQAARGRVI